MNPATLTVLFEDNHLLAVAKPAGLPTMGTPGPGDTLLSLAKQYVKQRYRKPGNVYLGIVSRLDAPVTGVVLMARTSKAARRLTEQFRSGTVKKTYRAIVEGSVDPPEAECVDWLGKDERHRRMHIVGPTMKGAQQARLVYRSLAAVAQDSLLEIALLTGRKHQIRLQLAHRGHPIVGDRKYGSHRVWPVGIALHAYQLVVAHPVGGAPVELRAPFPAAWRTQVADG